MEDFSLIFVLSHTLGEIHCCSSNLSSENTTFKIPNFQQLQRSQRFESGEPTAADKLYCYRIVQIQADGLLPTDPSGGLTPGQSYISIPAARQLIAGRINEESELVYMQRLKRSYELANQVRQ